MNDFAQVIASDKSQAIESLLTELEQKTGSQVSVVTVDSVEGDDIDAAAVDLFKQWGIGHKDKNDGVLILAAVGQGHHGVRIEVGYGMESVITDGLAGEIIRDDMKPFFKQGDYGQGFVNGAYDVARLIAQSVGVTLTGQAGYAQASEGRPLGFWTTLFLFVVIFSILSMMSRRGRGGYWGGFYGGGWGGGGFSGGGGGFGGFGGGMSGGGGASGSW